MSMTLTVNVNKGRHQAKFFVEPCDLLMTERKMREFAKACNVKMRSVNPPPMREDYLAIELTGTEHKIRKVAKACISWGGQ